MSPDAELIATLDTLEHRYGPFPLAIRKWYEVVGRVNLMGTHPKLSHHEGLNWGGSEQLRCYSDSIFVSWFGHLSDSLLSFYLHLAEDWDEIAQMEEEMPPPYGIDVGLGAINKANHSGSGSIQMLIPNLAFDAPLIDWDHYWMGTFFVPYLRTCFEWGGFPGLSKLDQADRLREEPDFLTDGLLPI